MLNKNWYFEKIDFEYQKYLVLGHLQEVEASFKQNKLYPHLQELKKLYKEGYNFIDYIESIHDNNKIITGIDVESLELITKETISRNDMFEDIKKILFYALPKFSNFIKTGQEIENGFNSHICIDCLGLSPEAQDNGILIIQDKHTFTVYKYHTDKLSIIDNLKLEFLEERLLSPVDIKEEYQNKSKEIIPFYIANTHGINIPIKETMLPIIKKKLIKILGK